MTDRVPSGVLDTNVFIDLRKIDAARLPEFPELTCVSLAELHQGVAMARDPQSRARRTERLAAAIIGFESLPFDTTAAARYGSLVGLTLAAGRDPKPRKMDLMMAAIASVRGLPLYTRNGRDLVDLDSLVEIVEV